MKVAALFSGGKDSSYAVFIAQHFGWDVSHLVTVFSESPESYMYHVPAVELTRLAAESIGIPLVEVVTPPEPEVELIPLRDTLATLGVDGIVSGALASEYQRRRLDQICQDTDIKSFAPLWHKNPRELLGDMVDQGFEIMIVGCMADGLDERWLASVARRRGLPRWTDLEQRPCPLPIPSSPSPAGCRLPASPSSGSAAQASDSDSKRFSIRFRNHAGQRWLLSMLPMAR